MNIFVIDKDPVIAASYLNDSHIRKMGLESVQMLCTAHRVLDGIEETIVEKNRKKKIWRFGDCRDGMLYKAAYVNHGCSIWCRKSTSNYLWLWEHANEIFRIFNTIYSKPHKSYTVLQHLIALPNKIPVGPLTEPYLAMPDQFKVPMSSVESYRQFYIGGKGHLAEWKNRQKPEWYYATTPVEPSQTENN